MAVGSECKRAEGGNHGHAAVHTGSRRSPPWSPQAVSVNASARERSTARPVRWMVAVQGGSVLCATKGRGEACLRGGSEKDAE